MSETARLVIVGCGAAKQDDPAPAKDLYTSTYFAKKREYAVELGDFWAVLSAEHGLIEPTAEIAPYDTTISDLDEDDLGELAHSVGIGLIDWVAHLAGSGVTVDEIVVLAGRSYIHPLKEREAFAAGIEAPVVYPLQQNNLGGIGEQMAWLSDRISSTNTTQQTLVTDGGQDARPGDEVSVYVDQELLTRAKGAVMLDEGREVTDDAVIGKALQALVDGPVAEGNSGVAPVERCGSCEAQEMIANAN